MNQGASLLLERMRTHPEEFTDDHKWTDIISEINERYRKKYPEGAVKPLPFLTDAEVRTLYTTWASLQGDKFSREVMRRIVLDEDGHATGISFTAQKASELIFKTKGRYDLSR